MGNQSSYHRSKTEVDGSSVACVDNKSTRKPTKNSLIEEPQDHHSKMKSKNQVEKTSHDTSSAPLLSVEERTILESVSSDNANTMIEPAEPSSSKVDTNASRQLEENHFYLSDLVTAETEYNDVIQTPNDPAMNTTMISDNCSSVGTSGGSRKVTKKSSSLGSECLSNSDETKEMNRVPKNVDMDDNGTEISPLSSGGTGGHCSKCSERRIQEVSPNEVAKDLRSLKISPAIGVEMEENSAVPYGTGTETSLLSFTPSMVFPTDDIPSDDFSTNEASESNACDDESKSDKNTEDDEGQFTPTGGHPDDDVGTKEAPKSNPGNYGSETHQNKGESQFTNILIGVIMIVAFIVLGNRRAR